MLKAAGLTQFFGGKAKLAVRIQSHEEAKLLDIHSG